MRLKRNILRQIGTNHVSDQLETRRVSHTIQNIGRNLFIIIGVGTPRQRVKIKTSSRFNHILFDKNYNFNDVDFIIIYVYNENNPTVYILTIDDVKRYLQERYDANGNLLFYWLHIKDYKQPQFENAWHRL